MQCSADCVTFSVCLFNLLYRVMHFLFITSATTLYCLSSSLHFNIPFQCFVSSPFKSNGVLSLFGILLSLLSIKFLFIDIHRCRFCLGQGLFILFGSFVSRKGQKVTHQFCLTVWHLRSAGDMHFPPLKSARWHFTKV